MTGRPDGFTKDSLSGWRVDAFRAVNFAGCSGAAGTRTSCRRSSEVASARAHYAEALGLVEYLVAERGEGAVSCLIDDLAMGASLDDSLRKEAQMSEVQFVSRFKTWAGL